MYVLQFRAKAMKIIDILIKINRYSLKSPNLRQFCFNLTIFFFDAGRGGHGGTPRGGMKRSFSGANSIDLNNTSGTGANKKKSFDD